MCSPIPRRSTPRRCSPPPSTSACCTNPRSRADAPLQQGEFSMPEAQKPRLKLYHASPSRSSVTLWMLEELGEPFEIELLSLKNGDQRKPEYLAVNPMGKVPTLDDAGTIVSEVSAICCYLADAYPKADLAPAVHDKLRGPYLKWLFYVPSCVEPAVLDKAMN